MHDKKGLENSVLSQNGFHMRTLASRSFQEVVGRNGHEPFSVKSFNRPRVRGKFLYVGEEKFWVKGVTYGTFHPDAKGNEFHDTEIVKRDFFQMAKNGINTVRTYTVPPKWMLDLASRTGLYVMAGLPWEQHVTFLDRPRTAQEIVERLRTQVKEIAGHPAILCYTVGNEIPASIVRWHGRKAVEKFLKQLYAMAKREDPQGSVTYVNFPTTEYLQLPFLDFVAFNVYLESQDRLEKYLARLHNLAGERPLVMAEIGLDSRRNGEETQALALEQQIRSAFRNGCAGVFLFSWTDEWYRGGFDIEDWDFGLTTRSRKPKIALQATRDAFAEVPFGNPDSWPRISAVVCSYNGSRTLRDTLEGLVNQEYPNYEVIVVDDGSKDATASIAAEFGVRLIRTDNRGLSCARNTGMEAANGEIVAYIDDDARPDPHWLAYLATTFMTTDYVGVGGPNLPPPGDGDVADCVSNAPGGPNHVLLSDSEAEHIPGCNMAFRKAALETVGGFDPKFRVAGDDIDLCWRLQERGWKLGFNPAAVVWHHRRACIHTYWRQQKGYGKAEALLEKKWPEKFNAAGYITWSGSIYGKGLMKNLRLKGSRIYQGVWGSAPFQSLYHPRPTVISSLTLMPEWYVFVFLLLVLSTIGLVWRPLLWLTPLAFLSTVATLTQAILGIRGAVFPTKPSSFRHKLKLSFLTGYLHLIQPMARLAGRLSFGLTPWWKNGWEGYAMPLPRRWSIWREKWQPIEGQLRSLQKALQASRAYVRPGGDYDDWDLEVGAGLFGAVRLLASVEEHGAGRQLVRIRSWPKCSSVCWLAFALFVFLSGWAVYDGAWLAGIALGILAGFFALNSVRECSASMYTIHRAIETIQDTPQSMLSKQKVLAA